MWPRCSARTRIRSTASTSAPTARPSSLAATTTPSFSTTARRASESRGPGLAHSAAAEGVPGGAPGAGH